MGNRIYTSPICAIPWTIDSPRTLISAPTYPWETHGDLTLKHVSVNEGPEVLVHGEKNLYLSASGCWTDFYALGAFQADIDTNLLDAGSWKKFDHPLLSTDAEAHAFGPGHNGFFSSPDGKQNWIIYHANPEPYGGCGNHRSPRIQPFTWNPDGALPDIVMTAQSKHCPVGDSCASCR